MHGTNAFSIELKPKRGGRRRRSSTRLFDLLLHSCSGAARQVAQHDDVAGVKIGHEDLAALSFELVAIDPPVRHHWGNHSSHSLADTQCSNCAMPVREAHRPALRTWRTDHDCGS